MKIVIKPDGIITEQDLEIAVGLVRLLKANWGCITDELRRKKAFDTRSDEWLAMFNMNFHFEYGSVFVYRVYRDSLGLEQTNTSYEVEITD